MIYSLRTNPKTFGAAQTFRLNLCSSSSHAPHPRPALAATSRLGHIRTFLPVAHPYRRARHQDRLPVLFVGPSRRLLSGVSPGAILLNKRQHLGRPQEYSTAAGVTTLPSINETMSSNTPPPAPPTSAMKTQIIKVSQGQGASSSPSPFGHWSSRPQKSSPENTNLKTSHLNTWLVPPIDHTNLATLVPLQQAASYLRQSDIPVAFPTETVYGLGADATRSAAVKGIYKAKGRPSDNPLIVHVCDLDMLRDLLSSSQDGSESIPEIYHPLITKFWPGPLTILLPNPSASTSTASDSPRPKLSLAPEVTAGLATFGARMPSSPLARSLIKLANRPLAAPSANASTKPSPTAAQHVLDDLDGRIELILDGGSCSVGVESTVVDGLCSPPVVLRPGGVSIEELKQIKGWEGVEKAYKDYAEHGGTKNGEGGKKEAPRAPGMKYKHYSPRATVVLYEAGLVEKRGGQEGVLKQEDLEMVTALEKEDGEKKMKTIAVIRTTGWPVAAGLGTNTAKLTSENSAGTTSDIPFTTSEGEIVLDQNQGTVKLLDVDLGKDVRGVAHGLFAALRELDRRGADIIFVEGVKDGEGQDIAAAVMNRLRKAASVIRS